MTSRMEDQPPSVAELQARSASARHASSNSSAVRKGKADNMMASRRSPLSGAVNHAVWPNAATASTCPKRGVISGERERRERKERKENKMNSELTK